jgi:hypothetical protein
LHNIQYKVQNFDDVLLETEDKKPNVEVTSASNTELDSVAMVPSLIEGLLIVASCDCLTTSEVLPEVMARRFTIP